MKKKILSFLTATILGLSISVYASDDSHDVKINKNKQILDILNGLAALDVKTTSFSNNPRYDFKKEYAEIDKIDDPMELARLILIADLFAFPQNADTVGVDRHFIVAGDISLMKKFKDHKDFGQTMYFIKKHTPLDAGSSIIFNDTLWEGRNNPDVKKWLKTHIESIKSDPLPDRVKSNTSEKETLTEKRAIQIAEAKLLEIYGERVLKKKPWSVEETDKSFIIKGTFNKKGKGGVAEIEINKADGTVIRYKHGK